MIPIELENWPRKPLLEKYAGYTFPYINIGAEIDVTNLYDFVEKRKDFFLLCNDLCGYKSST